MGTFLNTQVSENICYIQLDRGKSNAMHLEMIEEITTTFRSLKEDSSVFAVVLQGKEGFFTSGLDLITLFQYDEAQMKAFWEKFIDLIEELVSFPKPFITAVTGHSPAGGCVLALCSDYRVMAAGEYIIGLNEVPVGIIVPSSIFELYAFWIGSGNAARFLLEGKLLTPQEALNAGLVDEVVDFDRIQTTAARKAKQYLQFEPNAWRASKLNIRKHLLQQVKETKGAAIEQVLERWWAPSTRAILKAIIDNLTKKS
ncbi:enoyl-CoA hydratase/isomerase family protein [Sphingobacterium mizutaii]|uniref:enoyl-CoA hydratase/isomerase family protein n=1 Tax=Sphingobacterium mizutaii TaxID=1010 RepID=UPI001628DA49|nr:enoyl-CoA hydratase/isomerase family protein [Sphingobacterium mizutaii]